jgi:hypothetical protein
MMQEQQREDSSSSRLGSPLRFTTYDADDEF